ncbi:unnamed protein product [Angiostrongylus costaricensis]|uniref:Transposase n=1 Tax=Angiostrongylus costaricensis TaxID=334426 RepID=A0A0R3PR62_ANGCS|nr:unnamed protein product [Angiostrongylus costaricensis]
MDASAAEAWFSCFPMRSDGDHCASGARKYGRGQAMSPTDAVIEHMNRFAVLAIVSCFVDESSPEQGIDEETQGAADR